MKDLRSLVKETVNDAMERREYLAWKRKNVSYRGVREDGEENGAGAMLGRGLYTAALSNKSMTKQYGDTFFVVNAVPQNPMVFASLNAWEIWVHRELYGRYRTESGFPDQREFFKHTTIEDAMQEMGYDGIIIKGREMVNFAPTKDVRYYKDESQVRTHWEMFVRDGKTLF